MTSRSRRLSQTCSQVSRPSTRPLENEYLPLENDYLPPGKRLLVPWKTTTRPLENDYLPPGKRLRVGENPWNEIALYHRFPYFNITKYKETEIRFHFKVKTDLPGFCFTPYSSILIQNLLWLLFATNRSHLVNKPSLIMFVFSVSLSSFPEKI